MRIRALVGLPLLAAATSLPASAQTALPDTTPCPAQLVSVAICYTERLPTGAYLLAAMPKTWNGNLIVFAHGGPGPIPPTASYSMGSLAKYAVEVKQGFAWIASTYRYLGFGVAQSASDTDEARKFFIDHIAKPKRTIVHGASYGGLVGAKLIEGYSKNAEGSAAYDGAFFNSGMLAGAVLGYQFRADLRAVYQYYCRNLPRPNETQYPISIGLPEDSKLTLDQLTALVDECTGVMHRAKARSDVQKSNLANILGVMGFEERVLIRHMQYATFNFRDIALLGHGRSPFSNRESVYRGSENDDALNKGVERFDSDAAAVAALKADAEPTGVLPVPVMAIHSINDPQVTVDAETAYRDGARATGSAGRLVQAYTDEREHTGQSESEIMAALNGLMQWIEKGEKPTPQSVAAACASFGSNLKGPCRYHPDYEPKPLRSKFTTTARTP